MVFLPCFFNLECVFYFMLIYLFFAYLMFEIHCAVFYFYLFKFSFVAFF